jgi:hypothetical protein
MSNLMRNLTTLGLNEFEEAVIKATYDDKCTPKTKHVDFLITSSRIYTMLPLFDERLASKKWNIVIKTLLVIHKITLVGNIVFLKDLYNRRIMLNYTKEYVDQSTSEATMYSLLSQKYADYLIKKTEVFNQVGVSYERLAQNEKEEKVKSMSLDLICTGFAPTLEQFSLFLQCIIPNKSSTFLMYTLEPIIQLTLTFLIKDGVRLYSLLNRYSSILSKNIKKLNLSQTQTILKNIQIFSNQSIIFHNAFEDLYKNRIVDKTLVDALTKCIVNNTMLELFEDKINELENLNNSNNSDVEEGDEEREKLFSPKRKNITKHVELPKIMTKNLKKSQTSDSDSDSDSDSIYSPGIKPRKKTVSDPETSDNKHVSKIKKRVNTPMPRKKIHETSDNSSSEDEDKNENKFESPKQKPKKLLNKNKSVRQPKSKNSKYYNDEQSNSANEQSDDEQSDSEKTDDEQIDRKNKNLKKQSVVNIVPVALINEKNVVKNNIDILNSLDPFYKNNDNGLELEEDQEELEETNSESINSAVEGETRQKKKRNN